MVEISSRIFERIKTWLSEDETLSKPVLYTLDVKIASGSLGTHGIDCFKIGKFTKLSDENLLDIASATELAWTVILMHDDILDNDTVRYGESTAWVKYGKAQTERSIQCGLDFARSNHPFKVAFDRMYADCLSAMDNVKDIALDASSKKIESAYHGYTFGCYDYLLPLETATKEILSSIGYKKMLMAQLINDYKDTCGSRRKVREYPELRESQANYVTSLYMDSLKNDEQKHFAAQVRKSNSSETYEAIAILLKKNSSAVVKKLNVLADEINKEALNIPNVGLRTYMIDTTGQISDSFKSIMQAEILA